MMDAANAKDPDGLNGDVSATSINVTISSDTASSVKRVLSWNEFTQGATLHGLKYIFEPTFRIRRVMWLLAILTAAIIVTLEVTSRCKAFFRFETNVDVQVVYKRELTFPAVTLCNQNSFRLTSIADRGLYNLIDAVYSSDNASEIDYSLYYLDGLETEALLRQAAHQKTDLIVSCHWKGKPCDIETDFQEQLTGLGVCYTFNSGTNGNGLVADKPGSRSGLSLILNLEQYEYTKGPQSDAGVKILLHDQSEYPLMEDMGFAAAPGTHTLVGVDAVKIHNLPAPYGTCNNEGIPMSDCIRDCRTEQVIVRCGCKAPHMGDLVDLPSKDCSIEQYFSCVNNNGDVDALENETGSFCDCSPLCERTHYDSSLSYAQLSRFNIERVVLNDPKKQDLVWQKQFEAREIFQRKDGAVLAKDKAEFSDLITYTQNLITLADNLSSFFSEEGQFSLMQNISDTFEDDASTIQEEYLRRWYSLDRLLADNLLKGGAIHGPVFKPLDFTRFLSEYVSENMTKSLVSCLDVHNQSSSTDWCDELVLTSSWTLKEKWQYGETIRAQFQMAYISYVDTMGSIYENTSVNPIHVTQHQQCLSSFKTAINGSADGVWTEMLNALEQVVISTSRMDYIHAVEVVYNLTHSTRFEKAMSSYQDVVERFSWMSDYSSQWFTDTALLVNTLIEESDRIRLLIKLTKSVLLPSLANVKQILQDNISPMLEMTLQYMDGSLLKLELYHQLNFATFRGTPDALDVATTELLGFMKNIILDYGYSKVKLRPGFHNMFEMILPVVTKDMFDDFEFISLARSLEVKEVYYLIDNLYTQVNKTETMMAIVSNVFDVLRRPMQNLQDRIFDTTNNLVYTMVQQQTRLKQFADDVATSDRFYMSNFMKVDIYYKELKIDQIEQFPAFQALSLLGEVGGFLGLLLGASVLTFIEFLDFAAMTLVNKLRNQRMKDTSKETQHRDKDTSKETQHRDKEEDKPKVGSV